MRDSVHCKLSKTTVFPTPAEIIKRTNIEFRKEFILTVHLENEKTIRYMKSILTAMKLSYLMFMHYKKIEIRIESPLLQISSLDTK